MKKDLKKLRLALAEKKKAGLAKVEEYNALAAKADATDEEQAKCATLDAEIVAIEAEVDKIAGEIDAEEKSIRRAQVFLPAGTGARSNERDPAGTFGFKALSEFAIGVRGAALGHTADPRLFGAATTYNSTEGPSGEGFLVPPEFRKQIWEVVYEILDLLSLVDAEPTSSNAVGVPKDETTPWGATGVQAAWRAEAAQLAPSKAALTGDMVRLNELYAFVIATDELLEDAPRLEDRLTNKAGQAISWKASDSIMWGDGVGKPLGFMNAKALVTVAKDSGQGAATLSSTNIFNMMARLLRAGASKPIWLANSDILSQLATLTIGTQPVWTLPSSGGMQIAPDGFLLGRPLLFTEHSQTLGTPGDITLIDPAGYYAATKVGREVEFASSIHLYFDQGLQAFRWTFRFAGQPFLSAPVAQPRSANTKSHFVALAAR